MKRLVKIIFGYLLNFLGVVGVGAAILFIIWLLSLPPYPYGGFIGCGLGGLLVGYIIGVNRK